MLTMTPFETTVNDFAQKARAQASAVWDFDQSQRKASYGHGDEGLEPLHGSETLPKVASTQEAVGFAQIFQLR